MIDDYVGARRSLPLHAPVQQHEAVQDTAQKKALQEDEAVNLVAQDAALSAPEDYTISVQQVREHLRSKGVSKSKDTIQRWCREGDLDCQKLGVLGRYFTTEASLLRLEEKLLPDMFADDAGANAAARSGVLVQAETKDQPVQEHAANDAVDHEDVRLHAAEDTAASGGTKVRAASSGSLPAAELAELRAEVVGLTSQLEQAQEMNQFLRDEVVSARGQRGDVVKIAEQMLGTLETIAIGGRLERPKPQADVPQPAHERFTQNDPSAV